MSAPGKSHVNHRRSVPTTFFNLAKITPSSRQARLGDYRSVKRRYYRWIEMGVLDEMLAVLAREADLEWLMIDSTIVRAHQHAAGARKLKGGRMPKAWAGLVAD